MYSKPRLAFKYLQHFLKSSNGKGHGTHSPFVFHFITHILKDKKHYPEFDTIEKLRAELIRDQTGLEIEDFGAGSKISRKKTRTVSSIAKHSAKPAKYSQLLFRMIKELKPKNIIELGSSLGITSSYLAAGNPKAKLVTIEGAEAVAQIAKQNFGKLQLENVSLVIGKFEDQLSRILDQLGKVDFAFIDGNHRLEPTVNYFQQMLPYIQNESVLVFDDIHWSREMEQAWASIWNHEFVRCSIDLFSVGIVFFRREFHEKQHFTIRF